MALVSDYVCSKCHRRKHGLVPRRYPLVCDECQSIIEKADLDMHMAGRRALTLEQRVEDIEKMLFHFKVGERLKALEQINARY